ncbi:hypothetical protein DENSPDRAFT_836103 [Dentipellis sp. KUC8613]|nr:hypothetical protein DENSPDRAFT_836103 [Dentipellis sp. KUC8613]
MMNALGDWLDYPSTTVFGTMCTGRHLTKPTLGGTSTSLVSGPHSYMTHPLPHVLLLSGSTSPHCGKFRSPIKFAPHAVWIMKGTPRTDAGKPACGCSYCAQKPQKQINSELKQGHDELMRQKGIPMLPVTPMRRRAPRSRRSSPSVDAVIKSDGKRLQEVCQSGTWSPFGFWI